MLKDSYARRHWWAVSLALLLIYWSVTLWNLAGFPPLHNDETPILAPGYKLFSRGVYGLDMYTGFYGQERLYLEVPPLMSLLQGMGTRLWGVGVWQMRFLPVVYGTLTLALTLRLGRQLTRRPVVGVLGGLILVFWKWTPGQLDFLGSGVALIDVARVARYDILVAPLGLAALLSSVHARRTRRLRYDALAGFWAGLAGLANVYGLFWLPALWLLDGLEGRARRGRALLRAGLAGFGAASLWLPCLVVAFAHWGNWQGQFSKHYADRRFEVLEPGFYWSNLVNEIHRYHLGARDPETLLRAGFWLVVAACPAALIWLGWRYYRRREQAAAWLLGPCLVLPFLLGLLVSQKRFYYLAMLVPLLAIAIAWFCLSGFAAGSRRRRLILGLGVALVVLEGAVGIGQMQARARATPSPEVFYERLRAVLPEDARSIYGPHEYWFVGYDRDYRGFALPIFLAYTQSVSFSAALEQVGPDVVLLNPYLTGVLSRVRDCNEPPSCERQFWDFMREHRARLIGEMLDYQGQPVTIYHLER